MDVIAGVFYCLGFYILLVVILRMVFFSTHVKGSFFRKKKASPRRKVPGMSLTHSPDPGMPWAAQEPAGFGLSHALHLSAPPAQTSAAGGTVSTAPPALAGSAAKHVANFTIFHSLK